MDPTKRARAADLFEQGRSRADVARTLGVARTTSGRWYRLWADGGRAALVRGRRRGRAPRLPAHATAELNELLRGSPREAGIDLDHWSQAAVAAVIERRFGVRYSVRHIGRLLRRSGWFIPPIGRAAGAAVERRPFLDPDGNPLALVTKRQGPR